MPETEYRVFFNNNSATSEQLERIEEITVEQEMDMVWEARVQIPISTDENGSWTGEDEDFMSSFSRIRVEIRIGGNSFLPLIDGPIVGYDNQKNSEPGQSSIILIVQDDSVYLNREENVSLFENMLDHEIAGDIFAGFEQIASTEIEDTPSSGSALSPIVVQRGTVMQVLRSLSRRQGMHAYVLPGDSSGQSIGCFKSLPTETDGLSPLILLGADRNIGDFNTTNDAQRPAIVRSSSLHITDKSVATRTSSFGDLELLGDEFTFGESESDATSQILPPYQGESVDLQQAASAEAANASYSLEATGNVLDDCYQSVLQPYRLVTVMAGGTSLSGDYLINKVTHTLTGSNYSQSFSLRRNARTSVSGSGLDSVIGSIF